MVAMTPLELALLITVAFFVTMAARYLMRIYR